MKGKGKNPVVRTDKKIVGGDHENWPSRTSHTGIDHSKMDRSLWKKRKGICQKKGSFPNVLRSDVMADIDKSAAGIDP